MAKLNIARGGHVAGWDVLVTPDHVILHRDGQTRHHDVPNYGTDIAQLMDRPGARIGWVRFPHGGDEVIYLHDADDDCFGYALNLDCAWCSEWGYAPFRATDAGTDSLSRSHDAGTG